MLPAVVYQGSTVPVETTQADAVVGVVLSVYNKESGKQIRVDLSKKGDLWKGQLTVPVDGGYPLGDYSYQLWVDSKHRDNGSFHLFEGIDSEVRESPNERRLRTVQKTIDKIMAAGVSSYTVGSNQTTRTNLDHLRKERYILSNLVNIERRQRGLDPLPGSMKTESTYTYMG